MSQARIYGDADGNWVSNSWTIEYKLNSGDAWSSAFTNANAFATNWFSEDVSGITARYIRVTVNGGTGTQVGEIELFGTSGSSSSCSSGADTSSDNSISINELLAFISLWKNGGATISELLSGIGEWKNGC